MATTRTTPPTVSTGATGSPTRRSTRAVTTDVVTRACRAPSVHNTQPWTWRVDDTTIELYADRRWQLAATDPEGRNLVMSCGAALHHAQVAAAGLGWESTVERLPDGPSSDLLARIRLDPGTPTEERVATLKAIDERRTDRRRFTSWPVPDERLRSLAARASYWGVIGTAITGVVQRDQVESLLGRAFNQQTEDAAVTAEQVSWVDRAAQDGVPADVVPGTPRQAPSRRTRFGPGMLEDADREVASTDGLVVLGTVADDRAAWLATGEAMSALWLAATVDGLSMVPLTQAIEVPETRTTLQREVLVSLAVPHVVLRIGWLAISRTPLPPTPRRPLAEVLRD